MALPTIFGPLTSASGGELDGCLAAVGALTTIQCTSTGTNSIVLTPFANQPTVSGYGLPNPLKFGFTAPASSSGAVTLEVASLGFLPVYTANGVQATSGTLTSGNYYEVTYSGGAIYNSGNGAWVLTAYQASTGLTALAPSAIRGLQMFNNAVTPNTKIDFSFTQGLLVSAVGAPAFVAASSATIDLTTGTVTSTANGMDGTSRPASGWVYLYSISTGSGMAGLGSLQSPFTGGPALPAGYSFSAYLGAMYCDGSSNLLRTKQLGNVAAYTLVAATNTAIAPVIGNGVAGTFSTTSPVLTGLSVSAFVPPTASKIRINISNKWKNGTTANIMVAGNTAWGGTNNGFIGSAGNTPVTIGTGTVVTTQAEIVLEGNSIAWASDAAGGAVAATGWDDFVSAAA